MTNEEMITEIVNTMRQEANDLQFDVDTNGIIFALEWLSDWKDKQAKEQRKELIEKAKEYLSITYDFVASEQAKKETNKKKVIEGLIEAMEEEK